MRSFAIALFAALAFAGCADDSSQTCQKNQTEACLCAGNVPSAQVCQPDGTWGACACGLDASNGSGGHDPPDAR